MPRKLKLRSGLGKYLYLRDCYDDLIKDILASLPQKNCKTVAIMGTTGIGKSSLFLVLLKLLFDDPGKFELKTRSFYFQTLPGEIWLYRHVHASQFSKHFVERGEELDESIPLFADMETEGRPYEHTGISFIFTSFKPSGFKELTKQGWRKVMPTWSGQELMNFFNSQQFQSEYGKVVAERAYENIRYFGGSIRNSIQVAISRMSAVEMVDRAIKVKGEVVCDRFFNDGFVGLEGEGLDMLVHRNPQRREDGSYNFDAENYVYSFASPYVLESLLQMESSSLVTDARNKYNNMDIFGGGNDRQEFGNLCLHG